MFKREGSHAFDFWSTTRNLEVSWQKEEFKRATSSGRPPALPQRFLLRFRPRARPILKRARTRKSSHEQRRGAAVVFGRERSQALKLLTFGLPRATLKRSRSRTREGSHKQRRGAAVVFGPEGSDAFDFWSAACNLEASSNEGEFARATPSGRPPALPHAFDF